MAGRDEPKENTSCTQVTASRGSLGLVICEGFWVQRDTRGRKEPFCLGESGRASWRRGRFSWAWRPGPAVTQGTRLLQPTDGPAEAEHRRALSLLGPQI